MEKCNTGHMDQVGYDTYCKLLDEVVKELKGIETEEEIDVTIDIDVSSYIPESYIEDNSQKIEIYQNIALCRTNEDIKNTILDIEDRFGKMPKEVCNLFEIAKIKALCKNAGIIKIMQKQNKIIYYFDQNLFNMDIDNLIKKYKNNIKFSPGKIPYITYTLNNKNDILNEIIEFLK